MALKVLLLCLAAVLGSNAFPVDDEQDMSIFFDRNPIDSTDRIIGGNQAGHVPFMVALTTGTAARGLHCGGSILTANRILTAAHCLDPVGGNRPSSALRGVVGTNRWNSGGSWFTFRQGLMHPSYNGRTIKNDIALLMPSSNIGFSSAVQRVTVNFNFVNAGLACRVVGWGRTVAGGPASPVLMELRRTIVDGQRCANDVRTRAAQLNINAPHVDPTTELCAFIGQGRGTCHGDSGGPLMRADNTHQIGLVTWGLPCALGAPDMYTRLSAYRHWIQGNL